MNICTIISICAVFDIFYNYIYVSFIYTTYIYTDTCVYTNRMCVRQTEMEGGEAKKCSGRREWDWRRQKGGKGTATEIGWNRATEDPDSVVSVLKLPLHLTLNPCSGESWSQYFLEIHTWKLSFLLLPCKYLRDWTRQKPNRSASNMEPNSPELKGRPSYSGDA